MTNIVNHVKKWVTEEVKMRVIEYWRKVDNDLGAILNSQDSSGKIK
ncbi:catalase-related domain-containing protein [Chloroflexota bacterium]